MPKILIIDDREDNLISIKALIKTYQPDYKTVTALSGEEGIKLAMTEKPDTILLYINMAKMDGFEVCRQLKQDEELKHIPILFFTAVKTSSQDRIKGLQLGGDAYLTEPIDGGELIAQLSVMLRIKEAEDKLRSEKANLKKLVKARMKELSETNIKLQLEITERKEKEFELLESKSKLSEAQRIAKMGFLSWNLKTNEIELSDETIKLYGLAPETKRITPDFISNIIYFEDLEFVQNNLEMAVKGEKKYNIDHRVIRPDGEVIWVHAQAELIYDDDGNAVSLIGTIIDITERKQAEEKIARFSRIFEDSLNEIYLFKADTLKFIQMNKAAQNNLGYTMEELQKLTPIDLKPEFSIESFTKLIVPLKKGEKKKIVFRTVHRRKDQSLYDVEVHLQLLKFGHESLFSAIILDITERKQAEEALKKSEENLRTTLNSIGDAVISTDVNGNIIQINPIAEMLTGWREKDAVGKPLEKIFKIINEETREKVGNPVERVLKEGVVIGLANHTLLIPKQGEEISIADSGAPIRNEDGKITGVVLVFRDQTKEREAQKKLEDSEHWNKEIFEGSLDAIFIVDSNAHIVDVNKAATYLTGYSKDELLKMSMPDLHEDDELEAYNKFFKRIISGESITREAEIFRKDGTKVDTEFSNKRIIIGNVSYMHTIARDVTERKKNEEKIKQKSKQLLLLSKASTEINKVLDIEIILQQLVKIAIELTGSSSGAAALYENNKMVFKTYNDEGEITPINFKFEKGYGVSGWVLKTKTPYITNNAENDKHVIQKIRKAFNFHKLINVPIFNKEGELLGCFEIHNTKEGRSYNKNDIEILQGLAANTSVAIENAQMISERKKAKEILSFERDKFSYILNSLPIGVSVLDSDNKYVFINSTSLQIDCYPNDTQNLIGNNVKYNHPKNILPVIDKLINDFKSGKITSHFREAKRGKRTIQISYHALHNHEGKYTGVIRLVSDITEKKKSELLLKESEKKYRELFEKSDDAILIIENNKFVDCNNSTVKMLRYKSKEELLNTHPSALSPEFQSDGRQSFEKAEEMMRIAFQKGSHRFEWDHKKADGEVFPVEVLLTAVTIKEGKNVLHVVWRDITKRKKAEMELRESRQRLSSHLDNTPLGAIFWDVDFKVTDWNKSAEKLFGYSQKEALGKHANELIVPKEIQDKVNDVFNHLLTQTGGERSTNESITKNGKRILCDWYNVAVTDLNGKVTGVASLIDDITEKIKIRDELIKAKEKAEKSEKLKSEFLAQMSHEIRSPIHTILSFSQLLESELNNKIEGELKESFTAIKNAGQRVVRTIDLILDMSQIQTNSLETHFRNINLTEKILEPLYQEYYQAAKTKGLKLEFIKNTDDVNVKGDEYTLNQIVANLLNNAIKYTEKGEITLRIFRTEANLLAVEVSDTGIGISEEYLPKIFDSFTQEEQGYSRHYDGNGLGLALVKKYCQINNADIFVESEKWKGSTFRVVF